ncbi:hypothetical protein Dsin_009443 [Dipteronia sinensis]|uniref:Uncharacterized protein n=1 Tax=Dipteronia sinensis TaxID=43782 RepID=A0AAE0AQL1_9ROSI|nr:hypothetical protein Dsin_009443 [Dipteronia sinensis]
MKKSRMKPTNFNSLSKINEKLKLNIESAVFWPRNSIYPGRHLKLVKKEEFPKIQSPPAAPSVAVGGEFVPPPPPRQEVNFSPTASGQSPGIGHHSDPFNTTDTRLS